jgi:hypothetical protein
MRIFLNMVLGSIAARCARLGNLVVTHMACAIWVTPRENATPAVRNQYLLEHGARLGHAAPQGAVRAVGGGVRRGVIRR